jgi:hypothetical protein
LKHVLHSGSRGEDENDEDRDTDDKNDECEPQEEKANPWQVAGERSGKDKEKQRPSVERVA